jgi:hypothetical protein
MYTEQQSPGTTLDPVIQLAIHDGLQQLKDSQNSAEKISLQLPETERNLLKEISESLALSGKVVIESAINYLYFYLTHHPELDPAKILETVDRPEQSDQPKTYHLSLHLDLETLQKLEILGLQSHVNSSVIMGIHLLHKKLV